MTEQLEVRIKTLGQYNDPGIPSRVYIRRFLNRKAEELFRN